LFISTAYLVPDVSLQDTRKHIVLRDAISTSAPSKRRYWILASFLVVAALAVFLYQDVAYKKIEIAASKNINTPSVANHAAASKLIWAHLSNDERGEAMALVLPYLVDFVRELNTTKQDQWWDHKRCAIVISFGPQDGTHQLCDYPTTNCPQPIVVLSPLAFLWTTHLTPIWRTNGHVEALPLTRQLCTSRNCTKMSHFITLPHRRSKANFNRKPLNRSGGSRLFRP